MDSRKVTGKVKSREMMGEGQGSRKALGEASGPDAGDWPSRDLSGGQKLPRTSELGGGGWTVSVRKWLVAQA